MTFFIFLQREKRNVNKFKYVSIIKTQKRSNK